MQTIKTDLMIELTADGGMDLVRESDGLRAKTVCMPVNCADIWTEEPEKAPEAPEV